MTIPVARPDAAHRDRLPAQLLRQLARLLVLLLLTLAAGVGLAGTAAAHNVLTSSDPTDGSTLETAPTSIRLTFDQPVQEFEPIVSIIGPDGNRYESGTPVVDSTEVTAQVGTLSVAGAYSIAYRVVSADGHPVQGEVKFELAEGAVNGAAGQAPATTEAVPGDPSTSTAVSSEAAVSAAASGTEVSRAAAPSTAASSTAAAVASTSSSSGLSGWVWAAIALAGALIAAAIVVIVRRPQQP